MPELPEVETIVRAVRPRLVGRTIEGARVRWERTVGAGGPRAFRSRLVGRPIVAVRRRAKWFVLDVPSPARPRQALLGHLRMSGRLVMVRRDEKALRWERLRLDLDDGSALAFVDPRKFGRVECVDDPALALAAIGPEPLDPSFDEAAFSACLARRRGGLKAALLDPRVIAGIGNIYADESLHRARLHPSRAVASLRARERERLWRSLREVLESAIAAEGSTFDGAYRTPDGREGSFQSDFRVYGRGGEACTTCGATIRRLVVAGRGTHVCPRCQRAPRASSSSRRPAARSRAGALDPSTTPGRTL